MIWDMDVRWHLKTREIKKNSPSCSFPAQKLRVNEVRLCTINIILHSISFRSLPFFRFNSSALYNAPRCSRWFICFGQVPSLRKQFGHSIPSGMYWMESMADEFLIRWLRREHGWLLLFTIAMHFWMRITIHSNTIHIIKKFSILLH